MTDNGQISEILSFVMIDVWWSVVWLQELLFDSVCCWGSSVSMCVTENVQLFNMQF